MILSEIFKEVVGNELKLEETKVEHFGLNTRHLKLKPN